MSKEILTLENNISYLYKKNTNTPRMAFCLGCSINEVESKPGVYSLIARLLTQGTKNYNSEQLANIFEKYAIDFTSEIFSNYLRIKFVCLNEDFSKAIELVNEVITNSTFAEIEKEKIKLKGEITAELDSPKAIAMDNYSKAIFENHYYGSTGSLTKILENIDKVTFDEVVSTYNKILNNSKKSLSIVGALDKDEVMPLINSTIAKLPQSIDNNFKIEKPKEIASKKEVVAHKPSINQAHIVKGWQVATNDNKREYATLILLNIILGACGLSSRLFLELRDKKGLAYVVRSVYESFKTVGNFMIYIATEPNNIEVSLKGFDEEIEKIKNILVTEDELNDAKNNFIGKCDFINETNMQQACIYTKNNVLGFDFDFSQELKDYIKQITPEDIREVANKYFNDNYVLSIVKP